MQRWEKKEILGLCLGDLTGRKKKQGGGTKDKRLLLLELEHICFSSKVSVRFSNIFFNFERFSMYWKKDIFTLGNLF